MSYRTMRITGLLSAAAFALAPVCAAAESMYARALGEPPSAPAPVPAPPVNKPPAPTPAPETSAKANETPKRPPADMRTRIAIGAAIAVGLAALAGGGGGGESPPAHTGP